MSEFNRKELKENAPNYMLTLEKKYNQNQRIKIYGPLTEMRTKFNGSTDCHYQNQNLGREQIWTFEKLRLSLYKVHVDFMSPI